MNDYDNRVTRAKQVRVEDLEEGFVCAADVKTPAGATIIPAGTTLEDKHIDLFRAMGLNKIDVAVAKTAPAADPAAITPEQHQVLLRTKALIVDDTKVMRVILRKFMNELDMEIAGEAEDGRQAVALAETLRPDIITLDIIMPEMNGIAVLKELRERMIESTVIMVSSVGEEEKIIECMTSGAADFIRKPFHHDRVKRSLLKAVFKT